MAKTRRKVKTTWQVSKAKSKKKYSRAKKYKRMGDMVNKAYDVYKKKINKGIDSAFNSPNMSEKEKKAKFRDLIESEMEENPKMTKEQAMSKILNSKSFSTQEERIEAQFKEDLQGLKDVLINNGFLDSHGRARDAKGHYVNLREFLTYEGSTGRNAGKYRFTDPTGITGQYVTLEYDYSHGTWRIIAY